MIPVIEVTNSSSIGGGKVCSIDIIPPVISNEDDFDLGLDEIEEIEE